MLQHDVPSKSCADKVETCYAARGTLVEPKNLFQNGCGVEEAEAEQGVCAAQSDESGNCGCECDGDDAALDAHAFF